MLPTSRCNLTAGRTLGKMAETRDLPPNRHLEIGEALLVLKTERTYKEYSFNDTCLFLIHLPFGLIVALNRSHCRLQILVNF